MSAPAGPLLPISGKRLYRKTREDELLFPVMSDPLMQAEASTDEKASSWLVTFPHPKQMQNAEGILLVPPSQFSKAKILDKKTKNGSHVRNHVKGRTCVDAPARPFRPTVLPDRPDCRAHIGISWNLLQLIEN